MAASIVLIKAFPYRGGVEEYSTRYHFDGGAPATDAAWLTLDNNIRAEEKKILPTNQNIERTLGYSADGTPAVYERTFATAGTLAIGTNQLAPGDCAAWIRYATARRDSRGHPVYLRNYYHGVLFAPGSPDTFLAAQRTLFLAYGGIWTTTGFTDGSIFHKRTGPDSLGATATAASNFIGRRRLKRRG